MPPILRSAVWDVHVYGSNDPTTVIGGLCLTPGVTNANFYAMTEIIVIFSETSLQDENEVVFLRDENEIKIERDDHPLQPGKYYIVATSSFQLNNEPWLVRTISHATGSRVAAFCEAVRSRDRQCIISGITVPTFRGTSFWDGFEAAHIFPLAYEGHWIDQNYGRWITIPLSTGGSINSVQNGLLLSSEIHQLFDAYAISINPDVRISYIYIKD
jgi:HNH endonuclease